MKKIIIVTILFGIILAPISKGNDDSLHIAAHVGTSFALTTVAYGVCRRSSLVKTQENPKAEAPCLMLAGFTAMMIGFLYKHLESPQDFPRGWNRAMISNGVGVGLGVSNILIWRWK